MYATWAGKELQLKRLVNNIFEKNASKALKLTESQKKAVLARPVKLPVCLDYYWTLLSSEVSHMDELEKIIRYTPKAELELMITELVVSYPSNLEMLVWQANQSFLQSPPLVAEISGAFEPEP